MIRMTLSHVAAALDGRLLGGDAAFQAVSTDSRHLAPGELFVALTGPHFDGNDFVGQAAVHGAVAAVVSRPVDVAMPCLLVADTRVALGRLAALWRAACPAQVVAVTGSNGKTTLKEMIAAILRERGPVLSTTGNLNNDIGVPLTLLRLQDERYAVIEMGANHLGEIRYLSGLARPDVAVLNNAGRAHLEGFGSPENVARAKAEIIAGLEPHGTFVYNADSPWAPLWRDLAAGRNCLSFGLEAAADVTSPGAPGWTGPLAAFTTASRSARAATPSTSGSRSPVHTTAATRSPPRVPRWRWAARWSRCATDSPGSRRCAAGSRRCAATTVPG